MDYHIAQDTSYWNALSKGAYPFLVALCGSLVAVELPTHPRGLFAELATFLTPPIPPLATGC